MAEAKTSEVFNCSKAEFFSIIADYEKYPEFLKEVISCKVLEQKDGLKRVEYCVSVVKTFKYQLWMKELQGERIDWDFIEGDIFKKNKGYWQLEDCAEGVRATYYLSAEFGVFVPGPIAKALVSVNLPAMMAAYKKRVRELFGK